MDPCYLLTEYVFLFLFFLFCGPLIQAHDCRQKIQYVPEKKKTKEFYNIENLNSL